MAARKRDAIVAMRMVQIVFGVVSLVFLWQGEVPWQALMNGQTEQNIEEKSLHAEASSPLQLFNAGSSGGSRKSGKDIITEVIAGTILFAMSVVLLWRNEGHSVRIQQLFDLAKRRVKEVSLTADPKNFRELVCVSGDTAAKDILTLDTYNVTAPPNSAKLRAKVWMYQWVEHVKDKDNSKQYTYTEEWREDAIDSSGFHYTGHTNPACPLKLETTNVFGDVQLGDFHLPRRVLGQMQKWQQLVVPDAKIETILRNMSGYSSSAMVELKEKSGLQRANLPVIEFKIDPSDKVEAKVGDVRLCFEYVSCGSLTVLGVQNQELPKWTFVPLQYNEHATLLPGLHRAATANTNLGNSLHKTLLGEDEIDKFEDEARNTTDHLMNGVKAAMEGFPNPVNMTDHFLTAAARDEILFAVEEKVSAIEALKMDRAWESKMTSTIRLFSIMLMYASIMLLFSPLRFVFAYLWFLGWILHGALVLTALAVTCCCSSLTISVAYVVYRPWVSMLLIGGSGAIFYYMNAQDA